MPLSSITHILLKIFALKLFISGVIQLLSVVVTSSIGDGVYSFFYYAPSLVYFIAGIIVWFAAPKLSRLFTKNNDGEFNLEGVTLEMLFSTSFVAIGLYFALDSFAKVFNWMHFFTLYKSEDYGFHQEEGPSYYDLTESALTFIAGITLIFTARIWSAKLCKNKQSEQDSAPNPLPAE